MGECLIVRRGGESYELPVLSASYPRDVTVTAAAGASASFSISITTPGRPAEYTYQWYRNGAAVSGGTAASLTLTGLTAAATYSVYCKVTNKAGSVNSRTATLTVRSYLPTYTYTGSHQLIDEGNFNWRLRLLTSGTLTFSYVGSAGTQGAQAFLVGGGGGGGDFGAGGGGGYTKTAAVPTLSVGTGYSVVVGAGGAAGNGQGYNGPAGGNSSGGGRRPGRRGQLRQGRGWRLGWRRPSLWPRRHGRRQRRHWNQRRRPRPRRQRPGQHHARVRLARGHAVFQRRRGYGRKAYLRPAGKHRQRRKRAPL